MLEGIVTVEDAKARDTCGTVKAKRHLATRAESAVSNTYLRRDAIMMYQA
jgi:hypothetical protein